MHEKDPLQLDLGDEEFADLGAAVLAKTAVERSLPATKDENAQHAVQSVDGMKTQVTWEGTSHPGRQPQKTLVHGDDLGAALTAAAEAGNRPVSQDNTTSKRSRLPTMPFGITMTNADLVDALGSLRVPPSTEGPVSRRDTLRAPAIPNLDGAEGSSTVINRIIDANFDSLFDTIQTSPVNNGISNRRFYRLLVDSLKVPLGPVLHSQLLENGNTRIREALKQKVLARRRMVAYISLEKIVGAIARSEAVTRLPELMVSTISTAMGGLFERFSTIQGLTMGEIPELRDLMYFSDFSGHREPDQLPGDALNYTELESLITTVLDGGSKNSGVVEQTSAGDAGGTGGETAGAGPTDDEQSRPFFDKGIVASFAKLMSKISGRQQPPQKLQAAVIVGGTDTPETRAPTSPDLSMYTPGTDSSHAIFGDLGGRGQIGPDQGITVQHVDMALALGVEAEKRAVEEKAFSQVQPYIHELWVSFGGTLMSNSNDIQRFLDIASGNVSGVDVDERSLGEVFSYLTGGADQVTRKERISQYISGLEIRARIASEEPRISKELSDRRASGLLAIQKAVVIDGFVNLNREKGEFGTLWEHAAPLPLTDLEKIALNAETTKLRALFSYSSFSLGSTGSDARLRPIEVDHSWKERVDRQTVLYGEDAWTGAPEIDDLMAEERAYQENPKRQLILPVVAYLAAAAAGVPVFDYAYEAVGVDGALNQEARINAEIDEDIRAMNEQEQLAIANSVAESSDGVVTSHDYLKIRQLAEQSGDSSLVDMSKGEMTFAAGDLLTQILHIVHMHAPGDLAAQQKIREAFQQGQMAKLTSTFGSYRQRMAILARPYGDPQRRALERAIEITGKDGHEKWGGDITFIDGDGNQKTEPYHVHYQKELKFFEDLRVNLGLVDAKVLGTSEDLSNLLIAYIPAGTALNTLKLNGELIDALQFVVDATGGKIFTPVKSYGVNTSAHAEFLDSHTDSKLGLGENTSATEVKFAANTSTHHQAGSWLTGFAPDQSLLPDGTADFLGDLANDLNTIDAIQAKGTGNTVDLAASQKDLLAALDAHDNFDATFGIAAGRTAPVPELNELSRQALAALDAHDEAMAKPLTVDRDTFETYLKLHHAKWENEAPKPLLTLNRDDFNAFLELDHEKWNDDAGTIDVNQAEFTEAERQGIALAEALNEVGVDDDGWDTPEDGKAETSNKVAAALARV